AEIGDRIVQDVPDLEIGTGRRISDRDHVQRGLLPGGYVERIPSLVDRAIGGQDDRPYGLAAELVMDIRQGSAHVGGLVNKAPFIRRGDCFAKTDLLEGV